MLTRRTKLQFNFYHMLQDLAKQRWPSVCHSSVSPNENLNTLPMYGCYLWCKFNNSINKICVAYNNAYRILHHIPKYNRVRSMQVRDNLLTFDALIRKRQYFFICQCCTVNNLYINSLMCSDAFYLSVSFAHFTTNCLLY